MLIHIFLQIYIPPTQPLVKQMHKLKENKSDSAADISIIQSRLTSSADSSISRDQVNNDLDYYHEKKRRYKLPKYFVGIENLPESLKPPIGYSNECNSWG